MGRCVLCGPTTRLRLSRFLNLERPSSPYQVTSVSWLQDHLEITLTPTQDGPPVALVLEPASPSGPAFLRGPEVSLWVRHPSVPAPLAERLQGNTARFVEQLRYSDLVRLVLLDPDAVDRTPLHDSPSSAEGPPLEGISLPVAAQRTFTAPGFYADFFAAAEIRRAGCDTVDVHSSHTLVSHGDLECSYCAVCVPPPRSALVRLPVYESVRNLGRASESYGTFKESEDPAHTFCSDMTEDDVIRGAPGKLGQVLCQADRDRTRDSLLLVGVCLPDVLGEDQENATKDYAATTTTPVWFVPPAPRSWAWLARELLLNRRKTLPPPKARDPKALSLIGFSRNAGTRELVSLLAQLGISVSTFVLPELSLRAVAPIPNTSLSVYLPNIHWEKAYEHLLDDPGRLHLHADGPFGIQGTLRWLEQVCAALALPKPSDDLVEQWCAPLRARYDDLRAQARNYRLGLVVSAEEIDTLLSSRFTWGLPLASALQEFGFALDLFVGGTRAQEAAQDFCSRTNLPKDAFHLTTFSSLSELLARLSNSPCQAVFSNYAFDWRLVRTGKTPFSTLEFEMGFAGALATLERLLALCRMPLFRAARRFLSLGLPQGDEHG